MKKTEIYIPAKKKYEWASSAVGKKRRKSRKRRKKKEVYFSYMWKILKQRGDSPPSMFCNCEQLHTLTMFSSNDALYLGCSLEKNANAMRQRVMKALKVHRAMVLSKRTGSGKCVELMSRKWHLKEPCKCGVGHWHGTVDRYNGLVSFITSLPLPLRVYKSTEATHPDFSGCSWVVDALGALDGCHLEWVSLEAFRLSFYNHRRAVTSREILEAVKQRSSQKLLNK